MEEMKQKEDTLSDRLSIIDDSSDDENEHSAPVFKDTDSSEGLIMTHESL